MSTRTLPVAMHVETFNVSVTNIIFDIALLLAGD